MSDQNSSNKETDGDKKDSADKKEKENQKDSPVTIIINTSSLAGTPQIQLPTAGQLTGTQPDASQPTGKPPQKIPVLTYKPTELVFTVKIIGNIPLSDKIARAIPLSDKIEAKITIENNSDSPFNIDENLKIDVSSKFFECEKNDLTFKGGKRYYSVKQINSEPLTKNVNAADESDIGIAATLDGATQVDQNIKTCCAKKTLVLNPKINEITNEFLDAYPVTFTLYRSVGVLKKEEGTVNEQKNQLGQCEKKVILAVPEVEFTVKKSWLPCKGEQIDVEFTFEVKNNGNGVVDRSIPFSIECNFGKDFEPIIPMLSSDNSKIVVSSEKVLVGDKASISFKFYATRAGFPGYTNKANFRLLIGTWKSSSEGTWKKPVDTWKLDMVVLPNLFDTTVAAITGVLGILSMYRPDILPAFTDGLNVATLGATPGIIYLGYRILTWAKSTKETPKE